MLRGLYTSATGMRAQELLIDNTANNLANVNTNGFKRSLLDFADMVYTTVNQAGAGGGGEQVLPTGLQIGSGVRAVGTTKVFTPGILEQTGNSLDAAIEGDGFFKVQRAAGQIGYTRDGAFRVDANGQLVTGDGFTLDGNITIPADIVPSSIHISTSGLITGVLAGAAQDAVDVGQIQLYRFSNPAGLSSLGGNLYGLTPASGPEVAGIPGDNGAGSIRQGFIERSNVEVVSELVSLITAQRAYEINARAIRAGDEMLQTSSQIVG